ncbi:MAG: TonB-dependent receptor [Chitinophagaceae bacterium]|nr:TonB-dependent receptor [Chitinophagaceae bacterium]
MRKVFILAVILFSVINGFSQQIRFSQTVKGTVIDEQSGHVLPLVTVKLDGISGKAVAISDSAGFFRLAQVPVGRQTIQVSLVGYEETSVKNIEVTSSHEVVLEIKLREKLTRMDTVVLSAGRSKVRPIEESALVSTRQLSVDEAFRYSGTRNDPSRMAQNFAGVSGVNDARNDIIIRGNSPSGVLWRMDGIDIPNPNHFSTLGATGGPVSILNINTLKNSDFMTSAFPAQYGNALSGVFDLRLRNGNNDKYEFLGQMGFNGFEFGAEGPVNRANKSSFFANYRYSMVASLQSIGLNVGTGSATPYYQDGTFKINFPTKKAGTFSLFGLGGESHINFSPESQGKDNLYSSPDGSVRDRTYRSLTGVTGLTHTYFFNKTTSGKLLFSVSGFRIKGEEDIIENGKPNRNAFDMYYKQLKYTLGYTFNKKFDKKNQLTAGITGELNSLVLRQDVIRNGDSTETRLVDSKENALFIRSFINYSHRFNEKLSTNTGVFAQLFTLNNSVSIEPRWNLRYQFRFNQAFTLGAGLHSQAQPLEVYFYQTTDNTSASVLSNKNLDFVKSLHGVTGYEFNFSRHHRFKAEVYGQYIFDAAVEKTASSFSMLNAGADFGFPDKTNLVNQGKGYNYGVEMTLERFLDKGFYYLATVSLFESKYKGSDNVWRNTAFNGHYVANLLGGKEFKLSERNTLGIDSKLGLAGGQYYTPFNVAASMANGYVIYEDDKAYSARNKAYIRWDFKLSYTRNGRKTTQKWYVDLQNLTNKRNIYIRTLNPKTGQESTINQIGFFPNINYQVTF